MALTREQALAIAAARLRSQQGQSADAQRADMLRMADPTSGMSTTEKVLAGGGKALSDLWQGAKQRTGFADKNDVAETRARDSALMDTTAGKVGHFGGNVLATVPTMFIPGANTLVGASLVGGGLGALQPTGDGESMAVNAALGAVGGGVSHAAMQKLGQWAGTRLANRRSDLGAQQQTNAVRDATLADAQAAGYVFPPTSVKPSATNAVLEGIGGKIKTAQGASFKNQQTTNALAREAVGIAPDAPLNQASLQAVRETAGQAYESVASLQAVNWDKSFERGIKALSQNMPSGAVKNPANKEIAGLVKGLIGKTSWTGRELVDDIKLLREMGHANKNAAARAGGDTAKSSLGRAQLKASEMLEDLAERNLANNKANPAAIQELREARQLIAKTYSVQKALNEASGNVSASVLASELKKGKPLSGQLHTIARTGAAFPKATQAADQIGSMNPLSALDAMGGTMLGGVTAASTGNPLGLLAAAAPLARPAVRSGILSPAYQRLMVTAPSYKPGLSYTAPDAIAWNPLLRKALPGAAAMGLLGYSPE